MKTVTYENGNYILKTDDGEFQVAEGIFANLIVFVDVCLYLFIVYPVFKTT